MAAASLITSTGLTELGTSPMMTGGSGQFGYAPRTDLYAGLQRRIVQKGICILLSEPKMFNDLPNSTMWLTILRDMFEARAKEWSGINYGLSAEFSDTEIMRTEKMSEIINVTRAETSLSFTFPEVRGRTIQKLLEVWLTYGGMDPVTTVPRMVTLNSYNGNNSRFTIDYTSATLLCFEPTPEFNDVEHAAIIRGVIPESTGDAELKRAILDGNDVVEHSITFKGWADHGEGARQLAKTMLSNFSLSGANFANNPAGITGVSSFLTSLDAGYASTVSNLASNAIRG